MKKEALKKLLKSLGFSDAKIKEITDADEATLDAMDFAPLATELRSTYKGLFENDDEFVGAIRNAAIGKTTGEMERWVKQQFNITSEEAKDDKGVALPLKKLIEVAHSKSTAGASKDTQTLQQENLTLSQRLKNYEEVEIPKIRGEVDQAKHSLLVDALQQTYVAGLAENLRVPVDTAFTVLQAKIAKNYDLKVNDKGKLVVYTKGTELIPKSEDGTKLLGYEDIATLHLKADKLLKESNADENNNGSGQQKKVTTVTNGDGRERRSATYLDKAEQHAESLKQKPA
jgi:hypothetical protein